MSSFIYVIRNESGFYKIGFSNNPRRRFSMLQTSSAERLDLLGVVEGTIDDEREIHRLLARWRIAREWFAECRAMGPLLAALKPLDVVSRPLRPCAFTPGLTGVDAIRSCITFTSLGLALGITNGAISQWKQVPAERLGDIARLTGIPLHILRPDIFEGLDAFSPAKASAA